MLRLPPFRYCAPRDLAEAVALKAEHKDRAAYLAGGTDLVPKMKHGQREPELLIALGRLGELAFIRDGNGDGLRIGASTTLAALAADPVVRARVPALALAAGQVATPVVRNMATLGGNLCLETRCSFFDQSREWREAIRFCLKKDGDSCRIAQSSERCWAIQSSDTAPLLIALGARIELRGPAGTRSVEASAFYNDDGIQYLRKQADELVTAVSLPAVAGGQAGYVKVSRRTSVDFPVLAVAAWVRREAPQAEVLDARVVLGSLASAPLVAAEAAEVLKGQPLGRESIEAAAEAAAQRARPLDNADMSGLWRKRVVRPYVRRALEQLLAPPPAP